MTWTLLLQNLVHIAALFCVVGFLCREQLWLRLFAVLGDLCYIAYYTVASGQPLWSAMAYSAINVIINLVMMALILHDRRELPLSDNDLRLYQSFPGMTPGDFRRLRRLGEWQTSEADTTLTTEGQPLDKLFYVLDGEIEVRKGGRSIPVPVRHFIGEIAYLQRVPASATVVARPGTQFIIWPHDALKQLTTRHEGLRQSLHSLLSSDLATKVARA